MKLVLQSKKQEADSVHTFIFEPEQFVSWLPGQYMHYVLPHPNPDERGQERWFTISSAPYEQSIAITTRFDNRPLSTFKQALMNMKPGDSIEADGPKGSFVLKEGDYKHILIAGGIGITPYHSQLLQLGHDSKNSNAVLLYANRDNNFIFDQTLQDLAASDTTLQILKFIDKRLTEEDFAPYTSEANTIFYLSGPRAMVESYESLLGSLGIEEPRIMTDYFPGY